jgi:type IV pilus assembly protein PilC
MPTFLIEALDAAGKEVHAEIEAASERDAEKQVRASRQAPMRITLKSPKHVPVAAVRPKRGFSFAFRVRQKHLTAFTRQFATLLNAGLPIVRSIDILFSQLAPGLLKDAVGGVKEDVESGSSLSESLSHHPYVFDKLFVNMVRAGESGGVLDEILARLAEYREKAQKLQQRITGALIYPAAVMTIAGLILSFIMIFIVPRFEQMFKELDVQLPLCTRALMTVARAMFDWWFLFAFAPVLIYVAYNLFVRTAAGRLLVDRVKLRLPVFGQINSKSATARFCRTLGTLVQSGVPILDALNIIKNATGNTVVAAAVESIHASIREGDSIAEPMRYSGVFDELVVNMVQVGEETGELDKMLVKIADTYEDEVDTLVGALMSLLEPIMIVGMGLIVGFIVISLFLPLISIIENIAH